MDKKRKNPFADNNLKRNPRKVDDMSIEEITRGLKDMEKILGKEKFEELIDAAILELQESDGKEFPEDEDFDGWYFVSTRDWTETHPANLVCRSDEYYAELANDIADLVQYDNDLRARFGSDFAYELGRVIAAYLEDVVSETKVFSAMRRVCMQRYGYKLPFYDCTHDDYMPDHINIEDIRFLIWTTISRIGEDNNMVYSPLAPGWMALSDRIFDELDSRYEEAPESRRVADWLRRAFRKEDFADIREVARWLVFLNPLTCLVGFLDDIVDGIDDLFADGRIDDDQITSAINGLVASESWQRSMSPMGCPSKTLVAAIAAEFGYDALAEDIDAIEVLPKRIYAITQDKKTRKFFFETSEHEKIEVLRESIPKGFRPDENPYGMCKLLIFKGKYLLSGLLLKMLKADWEGQSLYSSLEQQRKESQQWIEILDGQQVVCVTDLKKLIKKLGMSIDLDRKNPDHKNFVVLISKEQGITIMPNAGYAFDIPGNRFFRKREAAKKSFSGVIIGNTMPHDVAVYIQKHNLLPEACIGASQGEETGRRIIQDYLAFWVGFYRDLPSSGIYPNVNPDENNAPE